MNTRNILNTIVIGTAILLAPGLLNAATEPGTPKKPNIVFVFADQWRAQATGYAGDPNLQGKTPHLDKLATEGIQLINAVSTLPACTPYRGSLMTGQYPMTHGLFVNDAPLNPDAVTIGKLYKQAGYDTGYVGKWHIDGHGRADFIPKERRQGFDYWKVLECTHNYNQSAYYEGDDQTKKYWDGYDAIPQTQDVQRYIKDRADAEKPFFMMLSWGGPHNPYQTAPEQYKAMFNPADLKLRDNAKDSKKTRKDLAGYYAHIAALDHCMGLLMKTLDETGLRENTILVFTSDHGDMLGSRGEQRKQRPWDESVCVPFLIRYPNRLGATGRIIDMPLGTPDIAPTLLGLSEIPVPDTMEGDDFSRVFTGEEKAMNDAALIQSLIPFGEWSRGGGREYRGIRTRRYTYVRDLKGPWLLYDNAKDPYQQKNLIDQPDSAGLVKELDAQLTAKLKKNNDDFRPGTEYLKKWGYVLEKGKIKI